MTQAHTARLSIAPDAETEVAATLRLLLRQPWLVAGRDDAELAAVRRNLETLRTVFARLGWTLVVERDLARLVKSPPARLDDWAVQAPSQLACSWVFLLAAAAEGLPQQVTIGQFVEAGKAAAAEAGVPLQADRQERRAIVTAVKELVTRGIVEQTDGQVESYLHNDDAPVLLTIFHTRLLRLIGNYDVTSNPAVDPRRWLAGVRREPDAARRMRRRLVDDTCVHTVELDEQEADWLSRRLRGDDGGPLAAAFGLAIERRSEGAAFVVPDDSFRWPRELGEVPFPHAGIVPHVALLLADIVAAEGELEGGPGSGWRGMERTRVLAMLTELAERQTTGRGGWPAERAADPDGLLDDAEQLLRGAGLLRVHDGWWWLSPATGRWEAPPNAAFAPQAGSPPSPMTFPTGDVPTGRPRRPAEESTATLFDEETPR